MNQTKTQKIFSDQAPYANPAQGPTLKLLFVCSVGMLRSPTAQMAASELGYNARACGSCTELALIPMNCNLINWADRIIFMNGENYRESLQEFTAVGYDELITEKATIWNIDDDYEWGNTWLYDHFLTKLRDF